MARPVEIDRDQAFQQAYELFWYRGYVSTSLNQLLETLGIGRSSFYAAFASKEALFVDVLDEYHEQIRGNFRRIRKKHEGMAALRAYLYQSGVNVSAVQRRKGCLAINSAVELADVDDALHGRAIDILRTIEAELLQIFEECERLGELDTNQSPEALARTFWIALKGLNVSFRQGFTRSQTKQSVDDLLSLYGA